MKTYSLISLTIILYGFFGCQTNQPLTAIDIQELTIQEVHQDFKDGKYNSQQLVTAYLERIENLDIKINAINSVNPEALAIAKALDDEYQRTKVLRPLHGIPLIVKNNIHTKGLNTTAGALALQNFIPDNDAFIIEKLVDAGAIILGKSNMAEWAFTPWGSFSSTNGATLNAYNQEYSSAGSSGGTGASIASNFGVIGLGTDTGGSIRLPSSHGSLVGFRPTMGLVSRAGIVPCELRQDMAGPMCRTVEDATRVLEIIAGFDQNDELTKYSEGRIPDNYVQFLDADGLKGSRIGVLWEIGETEMDPEILTLFRKAIEDMRVMGAEIIDSVNIPNFSTLRKNQWCDEFKSAIEGYLKAYVKNDTISTLDDIIRIGSKSKFTTESLSFYTTHNGRQEDRELECLDAYSDQKRIAFRKAIEDHMDLLKLDALIYPTWNIKPYRMDSIVEEYIGENTDVIAPHTGQPAFSIPMGFMKDNLPTGIEFLGRMYSESTLIKLVYSFEQGTKHRRPPDFQTLKRN
ncbi:MAG: amidase family protein [Cytophagales bacterium]|nr:amidase family protein [Cytophagales bacterium]